MSDTSLKPVAPVRPADQDRAGGEDAPRWGYDLAPLPNRRNVLTPEEIKALLQPDLPDDLPIPPEPENIQPIDAPVLVPGAVAQEPDALTADMNELAARLSMGFGRHSGVKAALRLREARAMAREDLLANMDRQVGVVACFGRGEDRVETLLALSAEFADAMIAAACGAQGSTGRIGDGWSLSAIDCALLEQLLAGLGAAFDEGFELQGLETDLDYVASLLPNGEIRFGDFEASIAGRRTDVAVIKRADTVREVVPEPRPAPASAVPATAIATARIARLSVPLSRLTSLKAGSTLLLGLPPDQPVEVLSGGRDGAVLYEGDVGRKGNKMAVRIARRNRTALKG